jgi:hypothetical protein
MLFLISLATMLPWATLALGQAVAYFVQWTIIGIVIGLIYKPLATP